MTEDTKLLDTAGPYRLEQETIEGGVIERIELRTDGNGPMGFYDMIYIYTKGSEEEYAAMPAHHCDFMRFVR